MRKNPNHGPATRLVHAGRDPSEQHGFVNTPIYRGSTVLYPTYDAIKHRRGRYNYGTSATPTMDALTEAWTELAGAAGTVVTPSGLAALTVALMAAVSAGDHLLVTDSAYRPTRQFCDGVLKRFGVETTYYDPTIGAGIAALMRENTRAVLVEAPGSQSFEMQDIPAIAEVVHARGGTVIMDNTWATPLLFPPHERGVDIAVEAGTKYLSGGSDLLLGLTSANAKHFPAVRRTFDHFALCAGPEDIFLALRGLRTMNLRLREHGRAGLEMARWLQARPEVLRVLHPALPEDPGHAIWKRDFSGASGLFGVILKPCPEAALAAMLDGLELFGMGFSWGGFESLVIPFDCAPYRTATTWEPGGWALRFHIGLEEVADLKADLEAGFARLRAAS
ncbi:cystathionine beta-lyase [Methylobacterium symbioticum]|uniref:Cystathionine beta-lyase MetC n=1 Tax=Methylobacterium symbioticum TaxID=2584084 RepID=A0A509EEG9_9HYPH|nr:cystathionine beta-lyase [Methylobacterium symbioticum]VUD72508.1 Cystathionine beta-lyase MetC [Methylobacterium symbioticum]